MIYAEQRLGELLRPINPGGLPKRTAGGLMAGAEPSLPPGISKRTSHQAQTLASNPEKVEKIITAALKGVLCRTRRSRTAQEQRSLTPRGRGAGLFFRLP